MPSVPRPPSSSQLREGRGLESSLSGLHEVGRKLELEPGPGGSAGINFSWTATSYLGQECGGTVLTQANVSPQFHDPVRFPWNVVLWRLRGKQEKRRGIPFIPGNTGNACTERHWLSFPYGTTETPLSFV